MIAVATLALGFGIAAVAPSGELGDRVLAAVGVVVTLLGIFGSVLSRGRDRWFTVSIATGFFGVALSCGSLLL
jgi:hypothetical protein